VTGRNTAFAQKFIFGSERVRVQVCEHVCVSVWVGERERGRERKSADKSLLVLFFPTCESGRL